MEKSRQAAVRPVPPRVCNALLLPLLFFLLHFLRFLLFLYRFCRFLLCRFLCILAFAHGPVPCELAWSSPADACEVPCFNACRCRSAPVQAPVRVRPAAPASRSFVAAFAAASVFSPILSGASRMRSWV